MYSGAFQSGFIASARQTGYEANVDYANEPGKLPTAIAASGLVASKPGDYEFRIALLATVPGHMDPHQFEQMIPVRVLAPTQSAGRE